MGHGKARLENKCSSPSINCVAWLHRGLKSELGFTLSDYHYMKITVNLCPGHHLALKLAPWHSDNILLNH